MSTDRTPIDPHSNSDGHGRRGVAGGPAPQGPAPQGPGRGSLIAVLVVMGLSVLGSPNLPWQSRRPADELAFGSPSLPRISPITAESKTLDSLGITIGQLPNWRVYAVQKGRDKGDPQTPRQISIRLIHHPNAIVATLRLIDDAETWPPDNADFGSITRIIEPGFPTARRRSVLMQTHTPDGQENERQAFDSVHVIPLRLANLIREQADYGGTSVEWFTTETCQTRPHRVHVGRLLHNAPADNDLPNNDLILQITVHELRTKPGPPDYQSPAFAELIKAFDRN